VLDPDGREQQRAFDLFRRVYNEELPHDALAQKPPATAPSRGRVVDAREVEWSLDE